MKKITVLDIICIICVATFCLMFTAVGIKLAVSQTTLRIDSPDGAYEYQLDKNQILKIKGRLGITTIEIRDKKFKFADSPCPNKTCTHCGFIGRVNIPIVCLPNGVSAYIVGKSDVDDVSR